MFDPTTGFTRAQTPVAAASQLAAEIEEQLGGASRIAGGLVLATAANGPQSAEIGRLLANRWPGAALVGTSFEGVLAGGQVHRNEPAASLLAWGHGDGEPIPLVLEPGVLDDPEEAVPQLEHLLIEAAGGATLDERDLVILFPDAHSGAGFEDRLSEVSRLVGGPRLVGAGAIGVAGDLCHAWSGDESEPGAMVGLLCPGGAEEGRVAQACGSRFASPWLEIEDCRGRWIDVLDGEPPADWVRRQLGLDESEKIEAHLDRLLVRLRDHGLSEGDAGETPTEEGADDHLERFVVGLDAGRGSLLVPGTVRRGGLLAFALPDPDRAREALKAAVAGLAPSPILLQFACRARDESLHGDADLESALVAHAARDRSTIGTIGPFQLGTSPKGDCRLFVHNSILAAFGDR